MIKKTIPQAATSEVNTHPNSGASSFLIFPTSLSAPLQANLFELAPDSDIAALIDFASQLAVFHPPILDFISDDLDAHGLRKKQERDASKRWIEEQTETLVDVPQQASEPKELENGRPRMEPLVILMFMLLRGSFGCSFKDKKLKAMVEESISLRIFLENRGYSLPGASTLEENLNALSNDTRKTILKAELALALDEELDDFEMMRGDSTAANSASAYPTDSNTIAKLLQRMCARLQKLEHIGLGPCELDELEAWITQLIQLKFRLDTINTSSAKQAEKAAKEEAEKNPQATDNQSNTGGQESAKQRLRRELYEQLYALGEKILPHLEEQLNLLTKEIHGESCPPKDQRRREQFLKEFEADLEAVKRAIKYSRARVCEGKKPSTKLGEMPWSVSDMSASFIEKGAWDKTFGYRIQLGFSATNLVVAMIVPEGNAADQSQFIPLVKETIENTTVVPNVVSTDDGYTGAEQLKECKRLGVKLVSFSGARGKALIGEEEWNSEEHQAARRARNGSESGISVLKAIEEFEQLGRVGIEAVTGEQLEKVLAHNALKIVYLRKRKYEEEHGRRWNVGLPGGRQEVA